MSDELNSRQELYVLIVPCDYFNADIFLRSALLSAIMNYNLGRLRRFLTSQEDAEGGAINYIFKKRAPTENPRICPRHAEMPPQAHLASHCNLETETQLLIFLQRNTFQQLDLHRRLIFQRQT